jgi:hypothetical protein
MLRDSHRRATIFSVVIIIIRRRRRKEGRKKRGCFFAAPIFWLWSQAWNNLSFDHLKKQIVLRLKKNQTKSEQKTEPPKTSLSGQK